MAKDKKRGLFSWLGFGANNKQTENQDDCQQRDATPSALTMNNGTVSAINKVNTSAINDDKTKAITLTQPATVATIISHDDKHESPTPSTHNDITNDKTVLNQTMASDVIPCEPGSIIGNGKIANNKEIGEIVANKKSHDNSALIPAKKERPTLFKRLKTGLFKTRKNVGSGFLTLFRQRKIDDELFEELEEQLLIADVGVPTTLKIMQSLTQRVNRKKLSDASALYNELKQEMRQLLTRVSQPLDVTSHQPFIILMVGVNGVGKTTTIGKLANQLRQQGKSVMLAAGDTFRAAAVEQLQVWAERNNIAVIAQQTGADSASVIFDAFQAAKARNIDVLIADTAGRLQNKAHLMEELKKIVRVIQKMDTNAPHEIMLTLDAGTGQNAISQAKLFNEVVGVTGITITKLDGTAKGGVIFAIADQFNLPIRYIGIGEQLDDLRPFDADDFIEALFTHED